MIIIHCPNVFLHQDMPAMHESRDGPSSNQLFYVYPFDFWEILGSYIRPEEVGAFARLCHATYAVVNRPNFWLALYRDVRQDSLQLLNFAEISEFVFLISF